MCATNSYSSKHASPSHYVCYYTSFAALCIGLTFHSLQVGADTISTVAGSGTEGFNSDGIAATMAHLNPEAGVVGYLAVDGNKNLYIADPDNHRVRKVDAGTGIISTVAGTGNAGSSGDGGAATSARLNGPLAVVVASNGDLYISDTLNNKIRKVTAATGVISTFGSAIQAPRGLAIDGSNNLYVASHDEHKVYKIDSGGNQSLFAGTGTASCAGDGGAAVSTHLRYVHDVAVDSNGDIYLAEDVCNKIRKVTVATGVISTVAGTGASGSSGDGGAATSARLNGPRGVVFFAGNLYIADHANNKVRRVDTATGNIATFAGTGGSGFSGDGGNATAAKLHEPIGLATDCDGSVYIYDGKNFRIRKVTLTTPASCAAAAAAAGSSSSGHMVVYVPFTSTYLLMGLIAGLIGWLLLRRS